MVAGMIGLVPADLEILKAGVELQARLALRHIGRVLAAISSKTNIRSVVQVYFLQLLHVFLVKMQTLKGFRVSETRLALDN